MSPAKPKTTTMAVKKSEKTIKTIEVLTLDAKVKTETDLEQQYGENVEDLCTDHEQLIE